MDHHRPVDLFQSVALLAEPLKVIGSGSFPGTISPLT